MRESGERGALDWPRSGIERLDLDNPIDSVALVRLGLKAEARLEPIPCQRRRQIRAARQSECDSVLPHEPMFPVRRGLIGWVFGFGLMAPGAPSAAPNTNCRATSALHVLRRRCTVRSSPSG